MSRGTQINKIRELASRHTSDLFGLRPRSDDYLSVMMVLVHSYGLENYANHLLIDKYDVFDHRQLNPAEAAEFINIIDTYLHATIEAKANPKKAS